MPNVKDENKEHIVSCFDESVLKVLNLDIDDNWSLPKKTNIDVNARMQFADLIPNNILMSMRSKNNINNYDVAYLNNVFTIIEKALSDGIPINVLEAGGGFVFPSYRFDNNLSLQQLWNKQSCESFSDKICIFDNKLKKGREGVKTCYLLGHVGSGKSTFINHLIYSKSSHFERENIITVYFEYHHISDILYAKLTQEQWNEKIQNILYNKIILGGFNCNSVNWSGGKRFDKVMQLCDSHNIIIFLDGFDSLSPNVIEKQNAKKVLNALKYTIKQLAINYELKINVKHQCKVVFCLRKCTYDSMYLDNNLGRPDENNAYFLYASEFDDVIANIISIMSHQESYLAKYKDIISDIIIETSNKILTVLPISITSNMDFFDNNYRRRLRYIASVIIVYAIRVSNNFYCSGTTEDIHKVFLQRLQYEITDNKKSYLLTDILVYGTNTSFNNHFSDINSEFNIGKLCGFVDNIYWYFSDKDKIFNNKVRFIIKLRVLQVLSKHYLNGKYFYVSKTKLLNKLTDYGYSMTEEEVSYVLDFLEKSLFVRSRLLCNAITNDADKKIADDDKRSNAEIEFKCSNYGGMVLENILNAYSYLSAVCQNTLLPKQIADNIEYKQKKLAEPGSDFYIDKNWAISTIVYLIYFLRVVKSVEVSNPKAEELFIHKKLIVECRDVINKILNSKNHKLTDNDLADIKQRCNAALAFKLTS